MVISTASSRTRSSSRSSSVASQRDPRAARVAVVRCQLVQVGLDHGQDLLRVGQQVFQVGDGCQHFLVLVLDLLALQRRQPPQLHVEDGLGLDLAELEAAPSAASLALSASLRFADGLDDLVQVGQGDEQPFQDVRPLAVAFASSNCVRRVMTDLAVLDVDLQRALEREQARLAVHQRQHLHAEGASAAGCICRAG